jgi:diaminopimelate epimerase
MLVLQKVILFLTSDKRNKNMKTYKQKNFKRNYDCTNVKFIQVLDNSELDLNIWELCDESEIDCGQLWLQDNKRMFGYL